MIRWVRVISWNVHYRRAAAAQCQGELLRALRPDLILLQEINPSSAEILRQAAGADWLICAANLRARAPDDRPVRSQGVAIAGHGQAPSRAWLPADVPLPERILAAETTVEGISLTAVSYHAPPGRTWGIVKPRQAVAFARWLGTQRGPVLLGADANTPRIDAADFAATRTHWHTGDRHLHGEPGDDLLFGSAKIHSLDDALRRGLADHPGQTATFAGRPPGPLAITHRTGRRKNSPGTGRRYDSIWITCHWTVQHIEHLYDEGIAAGSDHAIVIADLLPAHKPGAPNTGNLIPQPAPHPLTSGKPGTHTPIDTPTPGADGPAGEFIPGRYCRDCGWPFPASHNRTHCQVPHACKRRQQLPLHLRSDGCPRNDRVHPEWRDLHQ
jgi:endonuclease/exonuclease/phosphatase family metal-dependent hydrolase